MHKLAVHEIVESVKRRVAQGDRPIEPRHSYETLEEVIIELEKQRYYWWMAAKIATDPDDDPEAGRLPLPQESSQ